MLYRLCARLARWFARGAVEIFYRFVYFFERSTRSRTRRQVGSARSSEGLWCIFAHRAGSVLSPNVIAYLSCLDDCGYNVILVNNGPLPPALAEPLLARCHTLVSKSRGGRDFGCYQYGTRLLQEIEDPSRIRQVLYCNESVFIRPSRLAPLVPRIRDSAAAYIGITGSFEGSYHVSGWLFAVSGAVFRHPAFRRFWSRYVPYSSRMHAITRGEIGLSTCLQRHGIYPEILFDPRTVIAKCFALEKPQLVRLLARLTNFDLWRGLQDHLRDGVSRPDNPSSDILHSVFTEETLLREVLYQGELQNNTNLYNLLMLETCDFAFLKKDLVYRKQYFLGQIEEVLAGWEADDRAHIPEIIGFFRCRGVMPPRGSVAGYLTRHGLI